MIFQLESLLIVLPLRTRNTQFLLSIGGNVNWHNHYGQQYGNSLKTSNKIPHKPAIPLPGVYPDETIIQKDTYTPMFIAVLFTIVKTWKQPRCPSTDKWIKKLWYMYTMEYYSAIKMNEFESVVVRDEPGLLHRVKSERGKQISYINICIYGI